MTRASDLIREKTGKREDPVRLSDIEELRSATDTSEQAKMQLQKEREEAERTYRSFRDFIQGVRERV
ncbi:MAG: hypothetical protein FJ139_11190, partial [Deltaproteobacteria bacterium]|nr:hypothetical protein [Deltaproteobacteria bacterium]